jgi:hypothetical protein
MSFLKSVAAIQRESIDTSRVIGGVTFGLPFKEKYLIYGEGERKI